VFISLCLTEFTQIEILTDKALISRAFDRSTATLNAGDTLMDETLLADFQKGLLLLNHFNFFLNNPFDRFIAWNTNLILFVGNLYRFFFSSFRGLNLSLNFRYRYFDFNF